MKNFFKNQETGKMNVKNVAIAGAGVVIIATAITAKVKGWWPFKKKAAEVPAEPEAEQAKK